MKIIRLTQSLATKVDDEDYEWLNQWKWHVSRQGKYCYAARQIRLASKKQYPIKMHRQIMNAPKKALVDHRNHDTLDNRRSNLRLCTHSGNMRNSNSAKGSSSQYKGVSFDKPTGKWDVRIWADGKQCYLGRFHNEIFAAAKYDEKAIEIYGEFAHTNFKEIKQCVS